MHRFDFFLPPEDMAALQDMASRNGRSVADCMRWAITKVLLPMHAQMSSGAQILGVHVMTTSGRILGGGF